MHEKGMKSQRSFGSAGLSFGYRWTISLNGVDNSAGIKGCTSMKDLLSIFAPVYRTRMVAVAAVLIATIGAAD
jgi:hypothetical protein